MYRETRTFITDSMLDDDEVSYVENLDDNNYNGDLDSQYNLNPGHIHHR